MGLSTRQHILYGNPHTPSALLPLYLPLRPLPYSMKAYESLYTVMCLMIHTGVSGLQLHIVLCQTSYYTAMLQLRKQQSAYTLTVLCKPRVGRHSNMLLCDNTVHAEGRPWRVWPAQVPVRGSSASREEGKSHWCALEQCCLQPAEHSKKAINSMLLWLHELASCLLPGS